MVRAPNLTVTGNYKPYPQPESCPNLVVPNMYCFMGATQIDNTSLQSYLDIVFACVCVCVCVV